jgi:uncharacterized protein YjbI with pentapeptide repeats
MKKLLIALSIISGASYSLDYRPSDLETFEKTNICINCDLSNANFTGNHSQARLDNTNLSGALCYGINLSAAILTHANLTNSKFGGSNFSGADFEGAVLFKANFAQTNLYQANISQAQLAQLSSVCDAILPDGSTGKCN